MTHASTAALRTALATAALAALLPAAALAQPTPPAGAGLPSLTPRVFTSTGPTRVALPQVTRQPLTGFGPPPRSYVVPAEREPVVEPFEPPVEALPPLEIAAPAEPAVRVRPGRSVRVEALAGSYLARQGRLDLQATGESGLFFLDVDADGLSGSGSDAYVHTDRLMVRGGGQSYGAGRLRLDGVFDVGTYSLPGANAPDRRRRLAAGTTAGVSGLGAVPFEARVGYTQSSLGGSSDADDTTEGRLDGEGRVGLARNRVRLDAAGGLARPGGTAASGGEVTYASGGLAVATERGDGARLVVGVRGLFVRAADAGGNDTEAVGPVVDARLPLSSGAVAFATNAPRLEVRSLAALAAFNPFAASGVVVAPDVFPVDARAGLELGRGATRVRLYGAGTVATSRLVFEGTGGFFSESYLSAFTAGVGADLTAGDPTGVSVSAGVEARVGRTTEGAGTEALPFFAPVVARAGVAAPFAAGRGRAGLTVSAESARETSRFGGPNTPAFALVGLDARFDVGGPFAVVARAERLVGNVQRWPGYREAPFTAVLGLRLTR